MLGHATTTELHLLAARDRVATLGRAYRRPETPDRVREPAVEHRPGAPLLAPVPCVTPGRRAAPECERYGSSTASAAVAMAPAEMPYAS
jgi:hypothetical protein